MQSIDLLALFYPAEGPHFAPEFDAVLNNYFRSSLLSVYLMMTGKKITISPSPVGGDCA